jgi:hypothetical protein
VKQRKGTVESPLKLQQPGATSSQHRTTQEQKNTDEQTTHTLKRKEENLRTGWAPQEYQADTKGYRENKIRKKKPSKEKQDQRRSAQRTEAEGKKVPVASPPSRLFFSFLPNKSSYFCQSRPSYMGLFMIKFSFFLLKPYCFWYMYHLKKSLK